MMSRKVISFIWEKIYFGDKVPSRINDNKNHPTEERAIGTEEDEESVKDDFFGTKLHTMRNLLKYSVTRCF